MLNLLVLPLLDDFVSIGSPNTASKDIPYLESILGNHNINVFTVLVHANNLALTKLPIGRVFHLLANTKWHVGTNRLSGNVTGSAIGKSDIKPTGTGN
jgi:hypothetical protein